MEQELRQTLQNIKSLHHLKQTHLQLLIHGLAASPRLLPKLISAAFSLAGPRHAAAALCAAGHRANAVAHNTLIQRLAESGRHARDAFPAYGDMRAAAVPPNNFTFTFLLKACEFLNLLRLCECVHGQIVKWGFGFDVFVQNSLLDVYCKCGGGCVSVARQVFNEMADRDVVSWNSIVGVYSLSGDVAGAMVLFEAMPERNVISWNTIVSGFARVGDMESARSVFDRMPTRNAVSWNLVISGYLVGGDVVAARSVFYQMEGKDVVSWTAMVSAYAKMGHLDTARELFDRMPVKNVVSWNAMIAGYNHNSRYDEGLRTFQLMLLDGKFMPDEATLTSVVSACAQLGSIEFCNWINSYISKSQTQLSVALGNALIDMFAKCGDVIRARSVFDQMTKRCIITWTTMISGFAFNGQCREALSVYSDMCREGVKLDDIVFIAVLTACTHGGFVQEGRSIFKQMVEQYGIVPRMEHYGCMVDLLGRAGKLQEAVQFIESMPLEPNPVIWATLLSSCIAHGEAELTEFVSQKIVETEPFNSSYQVLVSNCNALEGRWEGVMDARAIMRQEGIEKVPGCSSIQVGREVHEFLVKDTRHEKRKAIYEMVDGLTALMRHTGHAPWISHSSSPE